MTLPCLAGPGSRYYGTAQASGFTFDPGWSGSGTFSDGQIVTVTKAAGGLSIPSDPRPLLWVPLETDFARDATYSRTVATMTGQTSCSIVTDVKPTNAAGAARQAWPIGSPGADVHVLFSNDPVWSWGNGSTPVPCYVSVKRRYNWDNAASYNDKCIRYWGASGASSGVPDVYMLPGSGATAARIITEGGGGWDFHDSCDAATPYYDANMVADTWYHDEHLFLDSSLNTFDGICRHYRNALRAHPETVNWQTRGTTQPGVAVKTTGYLNQYSNPTSTGMETGTKYLYLSHLYVTDTFFRFVLSPESTWTQATQSGSNDSSIYREIQLPTEDSGSDIGCGLLLRKGVHASTSGLYLWFYHPDGSAPQRVGVCD